MVCYGSGRMPGFPTLAPDYTNAIVSYVRDGVESSVPIPADAKPVPWDTQYRFTGHHKFLDIDGYPAITPPWGTLNAINMNTGEYAWKIPLGEYPELVAKGMKDTGSENYGGPIVTAGGLVFIAATNYDKKFRAFDTRHREARLGNHSSIHGKCDACNLRRQRAPVHRHCDERRRESASAAQPESRQTRRQIYRVCAAQRPEVTRCGGSCAALSVRCSRTPHRVYFG